MVERMSTLELRTDTENRSCLASTLQLSSKATTHYAGKFGRMFTQVAHVTEDNAHSISSSFTKSTGRVGTYVSEHWETLVIYTVAWALIIVSSGILYGFKRTALPLTIGMSAGLGFGFVTALLTTKVFESNETAVSWFAKKSLHVDPTTKQIGLTIMVAVYLAACIKFPHATGGITGAVIGNHLFTHFLKHQSKDAVPPLPRLPKPTPQNFAALQKEVAELRAMIEAQRPA